VCKNALHCKAYLFYNNFNSKGEKMKKLSILSAIFGFAFMGAASAADITVYYSPSCPHCHHALDFISNTLVYEYPELNVAKVNVMEMDNRPAFQKVVQKCEFTSGGVPILVIGEKCIQGYADMMQDEIRTAVEVDLTDAQKQAASENKKALADDAAAFRASHTERANVVIEKSAADESVAQNQKKNKISSTTLLWGLMILLVAGLGIVLLRKDNKK
jgi:glutaredoxin